MAETYTVWKLEDYIDSEERARGVLEAAAEEDPGDGTVICSVLSAIARSKGMSVRPLTPLGDPQGGYFTSPSRRRLIQVRFPCFHKFTPLVEQV